MHPDAEPIDDMAFQNAMEMASNDDEDDFAEGSTSLEANNVKWALLTLEVLANIRQGEDEGFKLNGLNTASLEYDEVDEDDTGDYEDVTVGTKRKRIIFDTLNSDLNHSKATNARIKNEGGEAFILDEDSSFLAHYRSSRVFGTFGRREFISHVSEFRCTDSL